MNYIEQRSKRILARRDKIRSGIAKAEAKAQRLADVRAKRERTFQHKKIKNLLKKIRKSNPYKYKWR